MKRLAAWALVLSAGCSPELLRGLLAALDEPRLSPTPGPSAPSSPSPAPQASAPDEPATSRPADTPDSDVFGSDCLPYDANNLEIIDEGEMGWILTDGVSRLRRADNQSDAEQLLNVARRHTHHCFIGRGRQLAPLKPVDYWQGATSDTSPLLNDDCVSYDPNDLRITFDPATSTYRLGTARSALEEFTKQADAEEAKALFARYTSVCFIGRDNRRDSRYDYISRSFK